jgi:hypothetical protein
MSGLKLQALWAASTGDIILFSGAESITDDTTTTPSSTTTYSETFTTNSQTPNSNNSSEESKADGNLEMILIIVGAIAGVLVVCSLMIALVILFGEEKNPNLRMRMIYIPLGSITPGVNQKT